MTESAKSASSVVLEQKQTQLQTIGRATPRSSHERKGRARARACVGEVQLRLLAVRLDDEVADRHVRRRSLACGGRVGSSFPCADARVPSWFSKRARRRIPRETAGMLAWATLSGWNIERENAWLSANLTQLQSCLS
eukprot:3565185-Pleurochrysis_carterae.AAC.2